MLLVHSMSHPHRDLGSNVTLWLTPIPPPGTTKLVVRCIALGLPETALQWDGTPIADAAASITPLWPARTAAGFSNHGEAARSR